MKKSLNFLFAALSMTVFIFACADAPDGQKVEANEAVATETTDVASNAMTYAVELENSKVNWVGSKIGGEHNGFVKLTSGELLVENDALVGGSFVLDMTTITDEDLEGEKKGKLEGHLKTGDFFEVEKYPTATFEITEVEAATDNPDATHHISGNLTMKDVTKSVTLPAKVEMNEDGLMAITPKFTINRTEWGIEYRSGILSTPKDKIINDEIGLQIELKAAPQAATM